MLAGDAVAEMLMALGPYEPPSGSSVSGSGQGVDYLQYHEIVNFLGKQVIYTTVKTIVVYPEIISIFVS